MKTAITELKENIDYLFLETKSETEFQKGFVSCLEHVRNFIEAKKLLEKEKQQIIKAVLDGSYGNPIMTKEIATKYYNETFKP